MPKLTERRQRETRAAIADAAIEQFLAHGFDKTAMADVAVAAGVSRRTVYRHFANKEDLVFEFPRLWLERFDQVLASREPEESVEELVRRALLDIAEAVESERDRVLAAFSVVQSTESLRGTHSRADDLWVGRIADLMMAEPDYRPDMLFDVLVMARSLVATTNTAIVVWSMAAAGQIPDEPDIVALMTRALDRFLPMWPSA